MFSKAVPLESNKEVVAGNLPNKTLDVEDTTVLSSATSEPHNDLTTPSSKLTLGII